MTARSVRTARLGMIAVCVASTLGGCPVMPDSGDPLIVNGDASPILWPANGHYYEVVSAPATWDDARSAAEAKTWVGMSGHLATITSEEENQFLTRTFGSDVLHLHWLGAIQGEDGEGPDGGWEWITGEPLAFLGWFPPAEPNNLGGGEGSMAFDHPLQAWGKPWNDLDGDRLLAGFVVEYE